LIVDRIDKPEPELLSAWLVLKLPSSSQLTFLPLFPIDDGDWERGKRNNSFTINLEKDLPVPNRQILEKLNASDLYWEDYVVTDLEAIAGFVDLLDGILLNSQLTPGSQVYSGEILKDTSPTSSILTQAEILSEICSGIPLFSLHPDLEPTIYNFLTHSLSSINITGITWFIQSTSTDDFNLKCEFPTLVPEY